MSKNERKRIRAFTALVNEVDVDIIHFGFEMREFVERCFVLPPVVSVPPIVDELLEVIAIGVCIPICARYLIGRPRFFKPLPQVAQHLRSNVNCELSDFIAFHTQTHDYYYNRTECSILL